MGRRRTSRSGSPTPSCNSGAMSTKPPALSQKCFRVKAITSSAPRRNAASAVAVYADHGVHHVHVILEEPAHLAGPVRERVPHAVLLRPQFGHDSPEGLQREPAEIL